MPALRARAVRWLSGDPFPGMVEVEIVDAEDVRHVLVDKSPIFGPDLTPASPYPVEVLVACEVLAPPDDDGRVRITTDRPWGVATAEGRSDFVVTDRQLVRD